MTDIMTRVASTGLAVVVALALAFVTPAVSYAGPRGGGGGKGAHGGGGSGRHGGQWSGRGGGGHWRGDGRHWRGHGGHWHGHGGWWGGRWWGGFYAFPYSPYYSYYPYYLYPYPYPYRTSPYPYSDYYQQSTSVAAPPASDQAETTVRTPPIQREVVYPNGKYVLHGDGVTEAWQWIWVPAVPPSSPEPR